MPHICHKTSIYIFCLFLLATSVSNANEVPIRTGYAYEKNSMELVYIEKHFQTSKNGKPAQLQVIYTDGEGNKIAGKINDFSINQYMPDFQLENYLTGHRESVETTSDKIVVSFTDGYDGKIKQKTIEKAENGIIDAGFDNAIISYWDRLIDNEVIEKYFLIPSMARFIKFRLYQSNILELDQKKLRVINIEPANFFTRALAGTTFLSYEYAAPILREYNGKSNMRDISGKNFDVVIKYTK